MLKHLCFRLEGKGSMSYRDGHVFEGQFKNWLKDGKGKMTYRNGDLHLGEWKGDDGKGTITHNDGSSYQVGGIDWICLYILSLGGVQGGEKAWIWYLHHA